MRLRRKPPVSNTLDMLEKRNGVWKTARNCQRQRGSDGFSRYDNLSEVIPHRGMSLCSNALK